MRLDGYWRQSDACLRSVTTPELPMADYALEVHGLGAAYGRHVVLKDVSLRLPAGAWFALLGPNGCGKSTLLDCIVGRLAPVTGDIGLAVIRC